MTHRLWSGWLSIRRRVIPWCMRPGCFKASYVIERRNHTDHRGNLCAHHFWRLLADVLDDEKWGEP